MTQKKNNLIILGDVGSGKTAYIASAMYCLLQPEDVPQSRLKPEYSFIPEIESGYDQLMTHMSKLVDEASFPAFTRPVLTKEILAKGLLKVRLFVNRNEEPFGEVNIECYDFPGERFRRFTRKNILSSLGFKASFANNKSSNNSGDDIEVFYENILRTHLEQATGCVLLVNHPEDIMMAARQDDLLSSLLHRLLKKPKGLFRRKKPRLERISLAISKADIIEERHQMSAMDYLLRYLPLTTRFAISFLTPEQVKAFWVSSVGKVVDRIEVKDEVSGEISYRYIPINPIRPFGVLESLLWALGLENTLEIE